MARAEIYDWQWWHKMAGATGYSAERLAKEMNISRRQLQRYTQHLFGLSPQEWLNQQRLTTAGELLKQYRSVKLVAFNLGFKQVSHFSREFKSHFGLCPVSYLLWHDRNHPLAGDEACPRGPAAPAGFDIASRLPQLASGSIG
jgi:AraC-like DNA-binding protein